MEAPTHSQQLEFFDPFAESGIETFNAIASFQTIVERYQNDEVEHDYTADRLIADAEALSLDAQFLGLFDQFADIAGRVHQLCQQDEHVNTASQNSTIFGASDDDGHGHLYRSEQSAHAAVEAEESDEEDDEEGDSSRRSRLRRTAKGLGHFSLLRRNR